jgi:hypothetical protein
MKRIPWNKGKKGLQVSNMKGKHHTQESNEKNRLAHLGKKFSPEVNKKKGSPGMLNGMYGKKRPQELKDRLSVLAKERYKDKTKHPSYGAIWTDEQRLQKSLSQLGSKNHEWQGGKSFEQYTLDWTKTLKRSIRERDHYTCSLCLMNQTSKAFPVHHIDYNKKNCNPNNLITLCERCHMKTNKHREGFTEFLKTLMSIKYSGGN